MSRTGAGTELSALLGSRICHDLISPLGAIANGVELLEMTGLSGTPELILISESVASANARIRLFRIAFGAAAPGQDIARSEIRAILDGVGNSRRLRIDWQGDGDVPRDLAKLVFLLLQCCESALAWGGTVTVRDRPGADPKAGLEIEVRAERLRTDPRLWGVLDGREPMAGLTASDVHFAFARQAADDLGRALDPQISETGITISF